MLNNDDKIEINELLMKGHSGDAISKIIGKRKQDVYAEIRKIRGISETVEKTQTRKKYIPSKLQKPKTQRPKIEKLQKPKVQRPKIEKLQKPKVQKSKIEKVQKPKVQKPKAQTPKAQTPKAQKPQVEKVQSGQKDREPTQFEKYSAHELARSRVQQHINSKINNLRDVDEDFNRLIVQLENTSGMRENSKMHIASEYYLYWSQGDREKAFQIEEKLFTQSGKETYIPSDVD